MPVLPISPPACAAEFYAPSAGKPYRPSNGTEGEIFHAAACARCTKWERATDPDDWPEGCMIELRALNHDIDDPEYPKEWIIGPDGQPTCTAFDERQASE